MSSGEPTATLEMDGMLVFVTGWKNSGSVSRERSTPERAFVIAENQFSWLGLRNGRDRVG